MAAPISGRMAGGRRVVWEAQPKQRELIECPVFEVFFGGARGGGKTEGSLGDWAEHSARWGENASGLFVRRKLIQLNQVMQRGRSIYGKIGAKWNEQRKEFLMPGGAILKFAYLEKDIDAEEYQGHSYSRVYVEEVTNFPSATPINKLRATVRSAAGVPAGMRLTGNPGGAGHHWVKKRYITPDPRGYKIVREEEELDLGEGIVVKAMLDRVFIPSKIRDNRLLIENDPAYILRLRQSGSAALVKAWLDGDWDAIEGAFFSEFNPEVHVLPADWFDRIPKDALRFRAFDWGSAKPFSVGWYAVSDGKWGLPDGAILKYREWYGSTGDNVGLKLTVRGVAKGILERQFPGERITYGVADPAIFVADGGPSKMEEMAIAGVPWRRADNKRIPGWEQLHIRLKGDAGTSGRPLLYFLETCDDSIRTIPLLQHDEDHLEDIDTESEDHAGDETRYACMSRPWVPRVVVAPPQPSNNILNMKFADLLRLAQEKRKREEQV